MGESYRQKSAFQQFDSQKCSSRIVLNPQNIFIYFDLNVQLKWKHFSKEKFENVIKPFEVLLPQANVKRYFVADLCKQMNCTDICSKINRNLFRFISQ